MEQEKTKNDRICRKNINENLKYYLEMEFARNRKGLKSKVGVKMRK